MCCYALLSFCLLVLLFALFVTVAISVLAQRNCSRPHSFACEPLPHCRLSGDYPEDEHQIVQFTISALDKVHLTVVCELLHGQYLAEFDEHFSPLNKSKMRIHLPTAFAKGTENESFSWVAVLDKEMVSLVQPCSA